jgi:TM2 domain-containing membrane protein YozV
LLANKKHIKILFLFVFILLSFSAYSSDLYTTTTNVNLRTGAGTDYKSITVITKGDTVKILENVNSKWSKGIYLDKIGYIANDYLQKIKVIENSESDTNDNSAIPYIVYFLLIVLIAIKLKFSGEKKRNQTTAAILSLFLGSFGFQKFYLGEHKKGIFSILFFWTSIPMFIGIIDFFKIVTMSPLKFYEKYNQYNSPQNLKENLSFSTKENISSKYINKPKEYIPAVNQQKNDDSIIDVNTENIDLSIQQDFGSSNKEMKTPHWRHTYVYSYDELKNATKAQKEYYFYFKDKVLNGEKVDIKGNSNYAFILYFDFINDYYQNKDIILLDERFRILGEICPKTRSYSLKFLQDELRKKTDPYSVEKLKELETTNNHFEHDYYEYNPDLYKLGNKYKDDLELTPKEVRWLNKFYNPNNVFLSIEGCSIATAKQYLRALNELEKLLKKQGTTLVKEVNYFKDQLKIHYRKKYEWGFYDNEVESEIYLSFFKRVENSVRDFYGHKRKLSGELPCEDNSLSEEFENRIGVHLDELLIKLKTKIEHPDLETQLALNKQNVNRWKVEFNNLKDNFTEHNIRIFVEGITFLEETNQNNPNIENIFFEASKFIAKYDQIMSLRYYAKYIYYDLKSKNFDNRKLTKTVQKSLFKTDEQLNSFKEIIDELIKTEDIQTALNKISNIYLPKRKKIKLDSNRIQEVTKKHERTVELLNEYLGEENEISETIAEEDQVTNDNVSVVTIDENNSIFHSDIYMGKAQEELVKMIVNNSFKIEQETVDKYAFKNGMLKNQLIDSINEACEEVLDGEVLIEEDEEYYVIEESYYQELIK